MKKETIINFAIIFLFLFLVGGSTYWALHTTRSVSFSTGDRLGSLDIGHVVATPLSAPLTISEDSMVRLSFVGDLMFDRNVKVKMDKNGIEYPLKNVKQDAGRPFGDVDLLIGNLEGAVSQRRAPEKSIDFAFAANIPMLLKAHGFSAVSNANNHGLDQGRSGFLDTQHALKNAGLGFFGDPVNDDTLPWETIVKGKRIAFFGYNITDNKLDEKVAVEHIGVAAKTNDIVIVFMHWGTEYSPRPPVVVRDLGRRLVDAGATAVIGAHPHVMEGMEIWNGHPIFWSLGNFVFDQYFSKETQQSLAITLGINDNHFSLELYPILIPVSQPTVAMGDERTALLKTFVERSDLPKELQVKALTGQFEW